MDMLTGYPPWHEYAEVARWLAHNNVMGSIQTTSVHLGGNTAWANPLLFADAWCNSTTMSAGQPLFYMSETDVTAQDLKKWPPLGGGPLGSLTTSLEMHIENGVGDYCTESKTFGGEQEDPRCARLTIGGIIRPATTAEIPDAKKALFAKHPEMESWPLDTSVVYTMDIEGIWLIDYFGGAKVMNASDYFYAKCPGTDTEWWAPARVAKDEPLEVTLPDDPVEVTLPPWDPTDVVHTARWLAHQSNYGVISTLSTLSDLRAVAFGNVVSIADGTMNPDKSTGHIYMYITPMDQSSKDMAQYPNVSITMSEAWLDNRDGKYPTCMQQGISLHNSTCARLVLSGYVEAVKKTDPAYAEAKSALFTRHPEMASWPGDHAFYVAELRITNIWMVAYYGAPSIINPEDYYNYNGL